MDIQGEQFWSQPWFTTRFKMRYDDEFLYVCLFFMFFGRVFGNWKPHKRCVPL